MTVRQAYRAELLSVPARNRIRHEPDGLLVIENGHVLARGDFATLAPRFADTPVESLNGLVVPGFVDTHVHYPQAQSIASHGHQLLDWLHEHIFPAEMAFADRRHADVSAAFFLDELLRHGTTSALVFATVHAQSVDALFAAAMARNMRIISGKVLMDLGPEGLRDTPEQGRIESETLIARWRGRGRLGYAVTPRFALTSSTDQLAMAGALLARHSDVLLHTHLAENRAECLQVAARFPDSADYLDVYDRYGLVTERSVFAHGIHLTDRALGRMAEARSGIAFCPTSNLFLGSGLFDEERAHVHGVSIGIGTDVGAGTSLSVLHTLGEAYKVAQLRGGSLDPFDALHLATAGGANLLGLGNCVGSLDEGQEADFLLLDSLATPLLAYRTMGRSVKDRLFALQILGDDRVIRRTYVAGALAHARDTGKARA